MSRFPFCENASNASLPTVFLKRAGFVLREGEWEFEEKYQIVSALSLDRAS